MAALLGVLLAGFCPAGTSAFQVEDAEGRLHALAAPATRIISFYPAHTRNLVEMGAGATIVAVGRSDEYLPDLPRLSYRDDPERMLALNPDLVLIRPMISRGYPELTTQMERVGVRVLSLQPRSMEEMFAYWRTLGRVIGRSAAAEQMIARFTEELNGIRQRLEAVPEASRQRVFFEARHASMRTFAAGSIAAFVLESAGGVNIAVDAPTVRTTNIALYGKERLLARAEEIDVYLAQQGRMNPITLSAIYEEPGFQVIRAVRKQQVYLVPERLVARPTIDLLEGIRLIHHILYRQAVSPEIRK